jgi:hypothetical protein
MSKADDSILNAMHNDLATALRKRINSGDATAADLSVARQFLKDNNVTSVPAADSPLGKLLGSLPFATEADADQVLN